VDPYSFSLEQLARVRAAIWTNRAPLSLGPRPNQANNVNALDYYEHFSPSDKRTALRFYKHSGVYTHAPTGPFVDAGYHGIYPAQPTVPTSSQVSDYVACMQSWWDAGLIPVHFVHPDGWSLEDMDALADIYRRDDVQRVCRVVVPTGWEPTQYGWKAQYWADIVQKVQGWFGANADRTLWALHTAADTDAPTGDGDDFPNGNAGAWQIVAPHIHVWLAQHGPYSSSPQDNPTLAGEFGDLWDPSVRGSYPNRLQYGYAGWPTYSKWPTGGVRACAWEQTSFTAFNDGDWPESNSIAWGHLALERGSAGAGDSCD
jgi:hypothetical protein